MSHIWDLGTFRKFRLFDCVVCRFTWIPGQHMFSCEQILAEY